MFENNRILLIDDTTAIHDDFRKILGAPAPTQSALDDVMASVFGGAPRTATPMTFEIDSAFQGQEGLEKVQRSLALGRPYAMAFVDVRMPPGWNGVETIARIWEVDPELQIVICTAYSDYSWQDIVEKVGHSPRLVILKKPFDNIEALQLAHTMTQKWTATRQAAARCEDLDRLVHERTSELRAVNLQLTREIGEREQAQDALRHSEERLSKAFDACPLPTAILCVFDLRVKQANPALLATTELALPEVLGQPLWELGIDSPEDFRATAAVRLFRGEAIRRHACIFRTGSGEVRRGLLWLEPFALAAGPHVLAILQDVTEQHSVEGQLRQAQKMEAVGHLAAGVAHDFNNLLTVIQCHTSLHLEGTILDRQVAASLEAVQQASERAAQLTRQLLAFSRRQVMEKGSLCLCEVVTNVSAMLTRLLPASIRLRFAHATALPPVHGDRCNIEQVIMNLVVNARDAMPSGGDIFVSTRTVAIGPEYVRRCNEARVGRFVCLEVRDTGIGMDEATVRRIFEPFFTTKDVSKGTGMGLATVHGIVKQHDGWVEVETAPGQGATFRVFLPETTPVAAIATVPFTHTSASVQGRTVLLAEDDNDVRALVRRVLEECGLRVVEAADGHEALRQWQEHRAEIDLLLTDMVMPGGLSGADLADRIKADRPELPVIYSSGYSVNLFSEDRQIRKDINYLPKPYLAHQLAKIITRALGDEAEESAAVQAVA